MLDMTISDIKDMVKDAKEKVILHWNYRNLKEIPEAVRKAGRNVEEIYLKYNHLECLPYWISDFSRVTNLYLHGNHLKSLPATLCNMLQLTILDLSNNELKDLPNDLGRLANLRSLVLNNNCIESLPPSMCQLQNLKCLHLSKNRIIALPEWLGSLLQLEEIFVDYNSLIEIPNRLTLLKSLTMLSVCSNNLSYLPLNGFLSSPHIRFDSNASLSYLSLPIFHHLVSKIQPYELEESTDALAYGCFKYEERTKCKNNIKLLIRDNNSGTNERIVLELPRQLICVYSLQENKVISLWEMSLRTIYCHRYRHKLRIIQNPSKVSVEYERNFTKATLNESEYSNSFLPYKLIMNGPTSICLNNDCNLPIFTHAWIIIGIRKIDFIIPVIVVFCSHRCAAEFVKSSSFTEIYEICSFHKIN
ncbi:leucine-rich repeat-containing protein 28-like [Phymastichus coffea]|uniref:leucine-rich repeat-containing protein 28-like n=1 Tax=Phymastichus coffea TaxID=108790 RepID=UPI00273B7330|nr:leucine-rich repeat-containing protein 28-like [Phymastichus coffea]